jgi:hypothetical protein
VLGLAVWPALAQTPPAAAPSGPAAGVDVAAIASTTFIGGCIAHFGEHDRLRERLRPGGDLYLPRLSDAVARPYLKDRPGEAYARPDAGVVLALFADDDGCAVFVQTVAADPLFRQVKADLARSLGSSFRISEAEAEHRGPVLARALDVSPAGAYRAELKQKLKAEPAGWRVVLSTASGAANTNLQAILTLSTRSP